MDISNNITALPRDLHSSRSTSMTTRPTPEHATFWIALVTTLAVILLTASYTYFKLSPRIKSRFSNLTTIPGCIRLGLQGKSNLDGPQIESEEPRVQALFIYPVKSCRGVELSISDITALGLKYDRLFSFAQFTEIDISKKNEPKRTVPGWKFITQRDGSCSRLAQLETELYLPDPKSKVKNEWTANGGCLIIRFPYTSTHWLFGMRTETVTIKLPLDPSPARIATKQYPHEQLSIWKDRPSSLNITSEIPASSLTKLKTFLGIKHPLALFRVANTRTVIRGLRGLLPPAQVGFADAFPVHVLNLSSIKTLASNIPEKSEIKNALNPRRFRANIYVSASVPFDEDEWKRFAIGGSAQEFHSAMKTARCTLPNVHHATGVRDRNEPWTTMKHTRVVDPGAKGNPSLGLSVIPLFGEGQVRVGDEIEVLERGEIRYEPMFP